MRFAREENERSERDVMMELPPEEDDLVAMTIASALEDQLNLTH